MPFIIPFPFDMLMRPIRYVEGGGGVFVCGAQKDQLSIAQWIIHRNQMDTETADWHQVFSKTEADYMQVFCGAYGVVGANPATGTIGKPTFITAGQHHQFHGDPEDPSNFQQIIMTSIGGETWNETHREDGGYCYAAGWHETEKKFYVQCMADGSASGSNYGVLSSSDGVAWSRAATVPGAFGGTYAHPLLEATGNPLVKDGDDQTVPNGGYYGWDKENNIIIKPKVLYPYYTSYPGAGANNSVEIIKKIINPETGAVTIVTTTKTLPIDQVTCVAYAGGIWQAGGFMGEGPDPEGAILKIATSTDDGETWRIDYSVADSTAFCLMGAPPEMF